MVQALDYLRKHLLFEREAARRVLAALKYLQSRYINNSDEGYLLRFFFVLSFQRSRFKQRYNRRAGCREKKNSVSESLLFISTLEDARTYRRCRSGSVRPLKLNSRVVLPINELDAAAN